ncbi:hypothetical protein AOL_s00176g105 [Orbilia oligospora ATCC 24927]|uniref:Uncharacterized protein n=1 Tax=Arthrobotrys oligospora (strain ATCC 24927 / CBS 115.81 / DSM 1491) TaxID=756982 RepID=G1XPY0_ARTOA|nr:hypothetical protein AOL_s00176g105 [Orbilia oligospora ATCC 24927]EGX44823.1 hypothetical protein AOL_s00176g105 [Orbilia oligospora ATCC 24927]
MLGRFETTGIRNIDQCYANMRKTHHKLLTVSDSESSIMHTNYTLMQLRKCNTLDPLAMFAGMTTSELNKYLVISMLQRTLKCGLPVVGGVGTLGPKQVTTFKAVN